MPDCLRTGSLGLDVLLGGGWKPGTINEIWGGPSSGKSTLAEHAVWELAPGKKALWLSMGTEIPHRPSGALVAQPRNAEQAFWIMETAVIGSVDLVIVDSANGLVRKAELDGDPDYVPHPQREYKDELNRLKDACRAGGAIVIFLSKPRENDRQPVRGTGISEKARDRVRLKVTYAGQNGSKVIEAWVHGRDDANTLLAISPGTGINWSDELANLAIIHGLASRSGSWIECDYERYHGIDAFAREIHDNTRLAVDLDDHVRRLTGIV